MKDIYFEMLDFEGRVPDNYSFTDLGYTTSLVDKAKEFIQMRGYEPTEKVLEEKGFPLVVLQHNSGGFHIGMKRDDGGKESFIFYNQLLPETGDIHTRAHEEAHAVSNLGLRKDLERMMGISNPEWLCEEDFCDQAGLYVLRKKGFAVPLELTILYEEKLRTLASNPEFGSPLSRISRKVL